MTPLPALSYRFIVLPLFLFVSTCLIGLLLSIYFFFQGTGDITQIAHRLPLKIREGLAYNWAGYATATSLSNPTTNSVSEVRGSWVVPTLSCARTNSYSSVWAGIDGYTSGTVEQIGTEQDCYRGRALYYAWYEMYPGPMFSIPLPVRRGDIVTANVKYLGSNAFSLSLNDNGKAFTTIQLESTSRDSAEWIVEAPSTYSGFVLPLANFGKVNLTNAQATINGKSGAINDLTWSNDPLTMINVFGTVKAFPSPLSSSGDSFTVTWRHR